jgi:organic radical activating enzyme
MVFMTSIRESLRRLFTPPELLQPGNYSFLAPPDSPVHYRLHLRVDENGEGVLIINASTILHLNQTATEYAYYLITQHTPQSAAEQVARRYKVTRDQALIDCQDFLDRILTLVETPDLDPVAYLDFDRQRPFKAAKIPYRLDCALTYDLPDGKQQDAKVHERVERELTTDEWKSIIRKAWAMGIPHIIFTGGEPTLRDDLVELLNYCETEGLVTGVISGSMKLGDAEFFENLLQSGLDHLMLILEPADELYWTMLESVLQADLFTAVHITITPELTSQIPETLKRLALLHPNGLSLSISDESLAAELQSAREVAADLGMELVWEIPVPYMHYNPVTLEVGKNHVLDGAGRAWLYIEPDGDVLPDQSSNQVLGNLLSESLETILSNTESPGG